MNQGKLIIFSAPSGSGKSTIVNYLINQGMPVEFSISACSRAPRGEEKHGEHYYFLSPEEFKAKVNADEFLEWEEVYEGNFYGTLRSEVERIWAKGKHVIFDIDVIGGINLKNQFSENALSVFIKAPSIAVLKQRLSERNTETQSQLEMRLNKAEKEMSYAKEFDLVIINDDLEIAQQEAFQKITDFING
ncbi:MAG: guanylate kinase [Flavobacteriales bacterium]|nr:guanylate kinase [Flavobacteriales bacterium]